MYLSQKKKTEGTCPTVLLVVKSERLLGRQNLEGVGHLLLPREAVLAVDFGSRAKVLATLGEKTSAQNDLVVAESGLVVVDVGLFVAALGQSSIPRHKKLSQGEVKLTVQLGQ